MEHTALYETAKNFADVVKQNCPSVAADQDACLCLIVADSGEIYSGVTSVTVNEGTAEVLSADKIAAMSLVIAGDVARQMINITIEDSSFFEANEDALRILINARPENGSCEVLLSPDEVAPAASLLPNGGADFLSGFDDIPSSDDTVNTLNYQSAESEGVSLGAPADFVNGFDIDESNPFYAAPTGGNNPNQMGGDVKSFYDNASDVQKNNAVNSYPNQMQQNGYPQGYPQQNGYPQQGGYPQGYPQQNGYPQQGGYPQASPYNQGGHSSMYAQQGGYPQANPYNQGGHSAMYAQQGGYPQANPYNQGGHSAMYAQQGGYPQANPYGAPASAYMQHGSVYGQPMNNATSQAVSSMMLSSERSDAYKKRLSNYLDDSDVALINHDLPDEPVETNLSKAEMLKQAKERKKVAKANFSFKKKME